MSQEVKLAVQRALDKLINRFGKQSDVITELRNALAIMEREERPASSTRGTDAATVVISEPDLATGSEVAAIEGEAEPPHEASKRTHGRKK